MSQQLDFYRGEKPVNFEQKCPLALVLDISGSMDGEAIKELNEGLKIFQQQILGDLTALSRLETMLITFNDNVIVSQDFALLDKFTMPVLRASGSTKLVDAVRAAITRIDARKRYYKEQGLTYYRPYIILITDGNPDKDQDVAGLEKEIKDGINNHNFRFWSFGVTDADMNMLEKISDKEFPPQMLKGVQFVKFFKWLSKSMSSISKSRPDDKIDIAPKSENENPFLLTM